MLRKRNQLKGTSGEGQRERLKWARCDFIFTYSLPEGVGRKRAVAYFGYGFLYCSAKAAGDAVHLS